MTETVRLVKNRVEIHFNVATTNVLRYATVAFAIHARKPKKLPADVDLRKLPYLVVENEKLNHLDVPRYVCKFLVFWRNLSRLSSSLFSFTKFIFLITGRLQSVTTKSATVTNAILVIALRASKFAANEEQLASIHVQPLVMPLL